MATTVTTRLRLTSEDKATLAEYWQFYEPIAREITAELRESLLKLPEWVPLLRSIPADVEAERNAKSLELQGRAIRDGDWTAYLEDLRAQGVGYAKLGVSFIAWYDVIAIYRELVRRRLRELAEKDLTRANRVGDGMNHAIDIAMAHLGEAYLAAKEQIIAEQSAALRELSVPMLQVRNGLLVIPLVGSIDTTRARSLIESLLVSIRDRRARGVVLDVTGVPFVDTSVANHLVHACEAAKLMGAVVVITGISPEMAMTLVGLGAELPAAETHSDLQEGIEQIERLLGY